MIPDVINVALNEAVIRGNGISLTVSLKLQWKI